MEVYYFTLQYPEWKKEYESSLGTRGMSYDGMPGSTFRAGSETEDLAVKLMSLSNKIDLVRHTVHEAHNAKHSVRPEKLNSYLLSIH